jgi:predicted phage baseplate assembly protein
MHAYTIKKDANRLSAYRIYDPASALIQHRDPRAAIPAIQVFGKDPSDSQSEWEPQRDLLNSGPDHKHFVVEIETDAAAYLRFGDDRYGQCPAPGTGFETVYRVGNGTRGNIGAEMLKHIVTDIGGIDGIRNPLPAEGGIEPESIEQVRQNAPYAFRKQERAVTPADYAAMVSGHPGVQKAAATLRWTGSWPTIFVTVDRVGGQDLDREFKDELLQLLDLYRMAGHDVEIDEPRYVSLEIDMQVCVQSDYFRSDVAEKLQQVFSDDDLPDASKGAFHPDNFTFGQPVYLSRIYEAAQKIDGVASVNIVKFQRQGIDSREALDAGKLSLERLEIARLDNDPNFPEHGVFRLSMEGGK